MPKSKPRPKRKSSSVYPPIAEMMKETAEAADQLAKDALRCKGIAAGYNGTELHKNTIHRFQSLGGRVRKTVAFCTRYLRALTLAKQYVDEQD